MVLRTDGQGAGSRFQAVQAPAEFYQLLVSAYLGTLVAAVSGDPFGDDHDGYQDAEYV